MSKIYNKKIKLEFNDHNIENIINIISKNGGKARIIGGAVRNAILKLFLYRIESNINPSYLKMELSKTDIDIATDLPPEKLIAIFTNSGFKAILTGIKYGTITIISGKTNYEITTLRRDLKTDGRYAEVKFSKSFEEDASRRDFTINALSYDIGENIIYDYFNGIQDLENQEIKFIGIAKKRIEEDYLRILRFFRFSCYYSNSINPEGLDACKDNINGLEILSQERIRFELEKIFSCSKNISNIVESMYDIGIFKKLSPLHEIDISGILNFEKIFWKNLKIVEIFLHTQSGQNQSSEGPPIIYPNLRLVFLLFSLRRENIRNFLKYMRFPNSTISEIISLYDFILKIIDENDKKKIFFEICKIWYYNKNLVHKILLVSYIVGKINESELLIGIDEMNKDAPTMPIKSEELKLLGFSGISLGIRKKYLESIWIKSGFSIKKEDLINYNEIKYETRSKNKEVK